MRYRQRGMSPEMFMRWFWSMLDTNGACWPWQGGRDANGYGIVSIGARVHRTHRIAWATFNGRAIPPGAQVRHSCDNPPCCNPAHLLLGTNADNVADRMRRGRHVAAVGDSNGARTKPKRRASGRRNGKYTQPDSTPRGAQHGRAKLTEADIPRIRAAYAAGETQGSLARRYGVGHATISAITRRETWVHVE